MASVTVTAKAPYSGAMTKTFLIRHRYYVADGATGAGTGWGAETSLKNALDLAIDKDEIWMKADECALTEAITCSKAVLIRGGFAGTEVSANARTTASRTVFDGGRTLQNMFQASLGAGELILDGIEFAREAWGAQVLRRREPVAHELRLHGQRQRCAERLSGRCALCHRFAEDGDNSSDELRIQGECVSHRKLHVWD